MENFYQSTNLLNLHNYYLSNLLNKLYNKYNIKFLDNILNYESHFYFSNKLFSTLIVNK